MNKIFFQPSLLGKIVAGCIWAVLLSFIYKNILKVDPRAPIEIYYFFLYGHLDLFSIQYIYPVLFWISPHVFLLFIIVNVISHELYDMSCYIFTRSRRRTVWVSRMLMVFAVWTISYYLIQFAVVYGLGIVYGFNPHIAFSEFKSIISIFILNILFSYFMITLTFFISIMKSTILALTSGLTVILLSLFVSRFFYEIGLNYFITFLPTSQVIFSWHLNGTEYEKYVGYNSALDGFPISFSIVYLLVGCILFAISSIIAIKHKEFL
ncbi:hypothetical protein [Paenibacillus tyrfis]|uniref:hypothetical protein n=1 Tax=Paenibacillus tyrfis TaxID=1501230 RepID=UPI00209E9748|nr:hypothetical protein [Paenibacillus tyrfis]MCP1312633.1 hypothetical protein [Paenibacillus tyrfis]